MSAEITLNDLASLIKNLRNDINKNNDQFKFYREQLEETKKRVSELESVQVDLIKAVNECQLYFKKTGDHFRKNNLLIYNVVEQPNETIFDLMEIVIELFSSKMDITIIPRDIDNIFRLGKRKENRPILIKLHCIWQKVEILKACKKLKGTNIGITEDFSQEVRVIRKKLIPYCAMARQENQVAFIRKDKLIVNGRPYSIENCKNLQKWINENDVNGKSAQSVTNTWIESKQESKKSEELVQLGMCTNSEIESIRRSILKE